MGKRQRRPIAAKLCPLKGGGRAGRDRMRHRLRMAHVSLDEQRPEGTHRPAEARAQGRPQGRAERSRRGGEKRGRRAHGRQRRAEGSPPERGICEQGARPPARASRAQRELTNKNVLFIGLFLKISYLLDYFAAKLPSGCGADDAKLPSGCGADKIIVLAGSRPHERQIHRSTYGGGFLSPRSHLPHVFAFIPRNSAINCRENPICARISP